MLVAILIESCKIKWDFSHSIYVSLDVHIPYFCFIFLKMNIQMPMHTFYCPFWSCVFQQFLWECYSFDAYNESSGLKKLFEQYKERKRQYTKRVLVDKIYRNWEKFSYCNQRNIQLSGPSLGRTEEYAEIDKIWIAIPVRYYRSFTLEFNQYRL